MDYSNKKDFILIKPTLEHLSQIKEYRQEFLKENESLDGTSFLQEYTDIYEWFDFVKNLENENSIAKHLCTSSQYIYIRTKDNKLVGMLQFRHSLNDFLKNYGGHIGYSIIKSQRGQNYATNMLKHFLKICKTDDTKKLLITCKKGNIASKKVILKNNGVYENTLYNNQNGTFYDRYWIILS